MDLPLALGVVFVCLILAAFFSSSETALLKLTLEEIDHDIKGKRGPSVVAARELIKSSSHLLVTILVGNHLVNTLSTAVASGLAIHYFGGGVGVIMVTILMTIVGLLFCEIVPKALAARKPRQVSYFNALPLYIIHKISFPVHFLFDRLIDPWILRFVGEAGDADLRSTESVMRLAGQIRQKHRKADGSPISIIGSTANASKLTASDIMVSRAEVFALSVSLPAKQVLDILLEERFTRVPVYKDSLDNILGLVHLKDVVKSVHANEESISTIIKPILRVPERIPILKLLREMQATFVHMAIVKDEYGVTQGVLTQEDILEEIVGEIRDEFDKDELMAIQKLGDDAYDVLGRVLVHDFNRESGWSVPSERGDTLSGLVFNLLGKTPRENDVVTTDNYEIKVVGLSGSRITHVRVARLTTAPRVRTS